MKKQIISVALLCLILILSACSADTSYTQPDKYDKENYIGAADVPKRLQKELDVTREEMSYFEIKDDKAYMSGYISSDTIRQVKKLISDYPDVKTIMMVDCGGSVDDISNLEASRLVRNAKLNTYISSTGHIASGGTDFFCAGVIRTAEPGAQIGVHSWGSDEVSNAADLPKDNKEHQKYIDYYTEMKMPDPKGFYFFTINAAPADGMHYMSQEEIIKYGLSTNE